VCVCVCVCVCFFPDKFCRLIDNFFWRIFLSSVKWTNFSKFLISKYWKL
jgi:hypothetical protein